MTMYANFKGQNVTPIEFMNLMMQRNGFVNNYFTRWDALKQVYNDIIPDVFNPITSGDLVGQINAKLNQKIPVLVQVDITPKTRYTDNDTHWVLVVGRNDSNDYWINDPMNLPALATSLMQRYGRPGQGLRAAIVSILPYR
jgi:hypothetical protein